MRADNTPDSVELFSQAFFGGIVKSELTGDKTIAYIRIYAEAAFDDPFEVVLPTHSFLGEMIFLISLRITSWPRGHLYSRN